jgi:hypothetical protein
MLVALKDVRQIKRQTLRYACRFKRCNGSVYQLLLFIHILLSFIFILGIEITYKLDEKINGFMQLHPTGS